MGRYHGKEGQMYLSITAAGAAVPVVGCTGWTFDGSTDKDDATAFGDANKIQVIGTPNAGGSFTFKWDETDSTIFDAADSGESCRMYLYRDAANAPTHYRYGTAYIDVSEDVSATASVGGSGTFSPGSGTVWSRKP
jgi:hypothetical protein